MMALLRRLAYLGPLESGLDSGAGGPVTGGSPAGHSFGRLISVSA